MASDMLKMASLKKKNWMVQGMIYKEYVYSLTGTFLGAIGGTAVDNVHTAIQW